MLFFLLWVIQMLSNVWFHACYRTLYNWKYVFIFALKDLTDIIKHCEHCHFKYLWCLSARSYSRGVGRGRGARGLGDLGSSQSCLEQAISTYIAVWWIIVIVRGELLEFTNLVTCQLSFAFKKTWILFEPFSDWLNRDQSFKKPSDCSFFRQVMNRAGELKPGSSYGSICINGLGFESLPNGEFPTVDGWNQELPGISRTMQIGTS